jgi:hypothetical protein
LIAGGETWVCGRQKDRRNFQYRCLPDTVAGGELHQARVWLLWRPVLNEALQPVPDQWSLLHGFASRQLCESIRDWEREAERRSRELWRELEREKERETTACCA